MSRREAATAGCVVVCGAAARRRPGTARGGAVVCASAAGAAVCCAGRRLRRAHRLRLSDRRFGRRVRRGGLREVDRLDDRGRRRHGGGRVGREKLREGLGDPRGGGVAGGGRRGRLGGRGGGLDGSVRDGSSGLDGGREQLERLGGDEHRVEQRRRLFARRQRGLEERLPARSGAAGVCAAIGGTATTGCAPVWVRRVRRLACSAGPTGGAAGTAARARARGAPGR